MPRCTRLLRKAPGPVRTQREAREKPGLLREWVGWGAEGQQALGRGVGAGPGGRGAEEVLSDVQEPGKGGGWSVGSGLVGLRTPR